MKLKDEDSCLRYSPTSSLESAAHETRGGFPADPSHHEFSEQRLERLVRETRRLKDWAVENQKLAWRFPRPHLAIQGRGGEHIVSLDPITGRFLKATRPDTQLGFGIALGDHLRGATPSEYLDRLVIHNGVFFYDVQLEWAVCLSGGEISIVTSQPAIKGRAATVEEIDELMATRDFERFASGIYYDRTRDLLLYDIYPRNVLVDANDVPHVIDPVIQRVTPDFTNFIR